MKLPFTTGQAWTLGLGGALAVTLLATSLPPVLRHRHDAPPAPTTEQFFAPVVVAPPSELTSPELASPGPELVVVPLLPATAPLPAYASVLTLSFDPPARAQPPSSTRPFTQPPAEPPAQPSAQPSKATGSTGPSAPLTVASGGYSSSDPASVAALGVPADGYPVSVRAGSAVDSSYLRLSGSATDLVLRTSTATGASTGPDSLAVKACRITRSDWTAGRPGPAVAYNPVDCARGGLRADGRWHFDLAAYRDRSNARGFALVVDLDQDVSPSTRTARLVFTQRQ